MSQPLKSADWSYAAAASGIVNSNAAVSIRAAQTGKKNFVVSVQLMAEALGTATEVAIRDGAGGTVLWRVKISTSGLLQGTSYYFDPPIQGSTGNLLEVLTLTASGTGAVYFNAQGYTA